MKKPKEKLYKFTSPSTDYPPEVVAEWGGEFVPLPDGRKAVKWPTVFITHTDAIPSDCPCPMGVPITVIDKGVGAPGSDFRIVGLIDGDGFVDGKNVYKRIIVVNEALRARLRGRKRETKAGQHLQEAKAKPI